VRTQREAARLLRASDDEMLDALMEAVDAECLHEELTVLTGRLRAADMRAFETRMTALNA